MSWETRVAGLLVVAAVAFAACSSNDDEVRTPVLERARTELLEGFGALPLEGKDAPDLGSIKSKADPMFLVATGRLAKPPQQALADAADAARRAGYTVVRPKEPRSNAIAAIRGNLVVEIDVYEQLGILRADHGESFVQFQVGERDSRLGWTQVG